MNRIAQLMESEDYYSLSVEVDTLRERLAKAEQDVFQARFRQSTLDAAFNAAPARVLAMLSQADRIAVAVPPEYQNLRSALIDNDGVTHQPLDVLLQEIADSGPEFAAEAREAITEQIKRYLDGTEEMRTDVCTDCGETERNCTAKRTACGTHHDPSEECDTCHEEALSAWGDIEHDRRRDQ